MTIIIQLLKLLILPFNILLKSLKPKPQSDQLIKNSKKMSKVAKLKMLKKWGSRNDS
jgi:hypothetical protein